MAARLGFFGAKGRAEAIRLAESRAGGFVIELAGLRQIDFLVFEIIDFKQSGRAFAGGRREDGRVHQNEAVRIEVIADAFDHLMTDRERRVLAAAAQPQVAMVHQEIDAVILGRDRIRIGLWHALHDFRVLDVEFIAAGRALLGADLAANDQRRFLSQVLQRFEQIFGQRALHGDALHDAGAVAQLRETDFAAAAQVVQPPAISTVSPAWWPASAMVTRGAFDSVLILNRGALQTLERFPDRGEWIRELRVLLQFQHNGQSSVRSKSMVRGQSMVPPSATSGNRCESSFPSLSCT